MAVMLLVLALLTTPPASSAPPAPTSPPAAVGEGRDPFSSPAQAMSSPQLGLKGMCWQHVRCSAVMNGPKGVAATLTGADGSVFIAREGDRLRNAVVVKVDPERRGVLLREPIGGSVAGFREIVLVVGDDEAIVREPRSAEPLLPVGR